MIIQVDSNTLINTKRVECVKKISDNKVSIHLNSGNSFYIYKTMEEVLTMLTSPYTHQLLNETCA